MLDFPNTRTRAIIFKNAGKGLFTFPKIYLMQRIVKQGDRVITNLLLPGGGVDEQDLSISDGLKRELEEELYEPTHALQMLKPCFNGNGIFIKRDRQQFNEFENIYFNDKLPNDATGIAQLNYYWATIIQSPLVVNRLESHKFSGIGLYNLADIDYMRAHPVADTYVNFDIPDSEQLNLIYSSL